MTTIHELAVTNHIAQAVIQMAKENGVNTVVSVTLTVGELRDLVPEFVQQYFNYCTEGTVAEGAVLHIERSPVTLRCANCACVFPADVRSQSGIQCPSCSSQKAAITTGNEMQIEGMEVR